MKVICNRSALAEALGVAGNVVASRTPKPVLLCLKLTAADNTLTVAATDLEVAIRYIDTQVQIDQPGEALVPADKLRDIVRESTDDTLSIEVDKDTAIIKGRDSTFRIYTQNPADYPAIPNFDGEADFEIPGGQLKRLIGQTLFAVARESSRYAFNGVLVVAKGKKVTFVSSDTRRLADAIGELASAAKREVSAIVPSKALQLVDRLINDAEEAVQIQLRENQAIFRTSHAVLTANLVEGQFPPYEEVIPKDSDKKLTANTAGFLSAIRRAALLTTEESKGVRLIMSRTGLVLTSRSADAGDATINFPCKFEGADVEVGFNPVFLVDALKVVDTDEITLELTAPNRPGLLRGGPNFLYVIMPVNLQ